MRFVTRRLAFYVAAAWAAITLNFIIPHLMPGNPILQLFARTKQVATPEAVAAMKAAFGMSTQSNIFSQYGEYLANLARGNLGLSISYYPASVGNVIGTALPYTLTLVGLATIISFILGTLLGIMTAWWRGTWADRLIPVTAFFSSVPYFWLGAIAILIFASTLGWFPLSGAYDTDVPVGASFAFVWTTFYHGVLPAVTIVVSSVCGWLLGMRNVMLSTIAEDYVLLARAKGLRSRRVVFSYAARNAILPNMAGFALSLGFIVSGSILVEVVFSYPGIGYVLLQAVQNQDYPLMQGIFLIITLIVLVANLFADLVYALLDPRTRETAR